MNRAATRCIRMAYLVFGICGVLATCACAESPGDPDGSVAPSIEVLALSRGRGVPPAAQDALQAIATAAEAARDTGSVESISREIIGLEGETRLCIVFRDQSALAAFSDEIRDLAAGVDLLQIQIDDSTCSASTGEEP